jgi:hypothetical protein
VRRRLLLIVAPIILWGRGLLLSFFLWTRFWSAPWCTGLLSVAIAWMAAALLSNDAYQYVIGLPDD